MSKPAASNGSIVTIASISLIALVAGAVLLVAPHRRSARAVATAAPASHARVQANFAALPLAFEKNQGQTDSQVKYMARGNNYTLFLTGNDAVFSVQSRTKSEKAVPQQLHSGASSPIRQAAVHMQLVGANSPAEISAADQLPGVSNYFIGNNPADWQKGIPHFGRVSYKDVYPGVNLAYHGAGRQVEFDFVVAAGSDPAPIAFALNGARNVKTDNSGNLIVASAAGDIVLHRPVAYQEKDGSRQPVKAAFTLKPNRQIGFELGTYDRTRELVIDPSVSYGYSTYLGGSGNDSGYGIAFDSSGDAYVTGQTASSNFPVTTGVVQGSLKGTTGNVFVTKLSADGSSLVYSTYIGGTGAGGDSGNAIAVDASGDAFVVGGTSSSDFPATTGVFQHALAGTNNAFVLELAPNGNALTYCTFLGGTGSDTAFGVALATVSVGDVFVVGKTTSADFPTVGAIQGSLSGSASAFVTKLNSNGTALAYSTYLGGSSTGDLATSVAADSSDTAYVTGQTYSSAFPFTAGAYQTTCGSCSGGNSNAFVTAINASGSSPYVYSTFLGGSGSDAGNGIAVDSGKNVYITGTTTSPFPTTTGAAQTTYGGNGDAFVSKLNPSGSQLVYSTYLGGSQFDLGASIAVDGSGNAYVTGQTSSTNFPTAGATNTQATLSGAPDAFVSELSSSGAQLSFSTYLGGSGDEDVGGKYGAIAVDSAGANIYVTGNTSPAAGSSANFPTTSGAEQSTAGGATDAFVVKYTQGTSQTFSLSATALSPSSVTPGQTSTSTVTVTPAGGFSGTVTFACTVSPVVSLGPTCSGSGSPASPGTLTVSTTPATGSLSMPGRGNSRGIFYAMMLPFAGLSLVGIGFRAGPRRRKLFGILLIGMIMVSFTLMPACGGSSHSSGGSSGTPAGSYTVTVTGTATGATQTGTSPSLTLTVN